MTGMAIELARFLFWVAVGMIVLVIVGGSSSDPGPPPPKSA